MKNLRFLLAVGICLLSISVFPVKIIAQNDEVASFRGRSFDEKKLLENVQEVKTQRIEYARAMNLPQPSVDTEKISVSLIVDWATKILEEEFEQDTVIHEEEVEKEYIYYVQKGEFPPYESLAPKFHAYKDSFEKYQNLIKEDVPPSEATKQSHQYLNTLPPFNKTQMPIGAWRLLISKFSKSGSFCCYPLSAEEYDENNKLQVRKGLIQRYQGALFANAKKDFSSTVIRDFVTKTSPTTNIDKAVKRIAESRGYNQLVALVLQEQLIIFDEKLKKAVEDRLELDFKSSTSLEKYRFELISNE
jgi:hypothetical protein